MLFLNTLKGVSWPKFTENLRQVLLRKPQLGQTGPQIDGSYNQLVIQKACSEI